MKKKLLCRYAVQFCVLAMLICCVFSCEGGAWGSFYYTEEELKNDLQSVDFIYREYPSEGYDYVDYVYEITDVEQQQEIAERLAAIEYPNYRGAPRHGSSYVICLHYSDKSIEFSPYNIDVFDENGDYLYEQSHQQNFTKELVALLDEYASILEVDTTPTLD